MDGKRRVTRDGVMIAAAAVARMDVTMRPSPICDCVHVGGETLATQWEHADAVLHVRVWPPDAQSEPQIGFYRHLATVIDILKAPAGQLTLPIFVFQNQRSAAPGPYDVGQEIVLFLDRGRAGTFAITNDVPELAGTTGSGEPAMAFVIEENRIQRAPSGFSQYVGMPLTDFLDQLRAFPRRK